MPLTYKFEPKEGYLLVTTMGASDSAGDILQYAANVASEVAKCGKDKVLVDESNAVVRLKFHEILMNAKPFFRVCSKRPAVKRTAIVCKKHSFCLYSYLVERMSMLIRSRLKLFTDRLAAEAWLLSDDS